jgi:hypothetical protein
MLTRFRPAPVVFASLLSAVLAPALHAWGEEGHRMVNRLALAALPAEFPEFVRTPDNANRVVFLANVPDRWRNADPFLKQSGGAWVDHFLDIEQLAWAGLDAKTLPSLRFDFVLVFAAGRHAHAEKFATFDPATNLDHTKEWPGFAPWGMAECYHRLRAAFGYLKAYEEVGGTPEEIANAKADVVYWMGVVGHYVGDCAQPLHTTVHHNGWAGPNPNGYTTWAGFHSWIDSGFITKAGVKPADLLSRLKPVEPLVLAPRADGRDPFFVAAMDYILAQHQLVEPLYQLEKSGKLGNGDNPVTPEGRAFIEARLQTGAEMLARVWATAWKNPPIDSYLRTQLGQRAAVAAPANAPKSSNPPDATKKGP